MTDRIELWSCGGGRQSAGIAALIVQGRLPAPDHVVMVALEWERKETYRYVNGFIRPAIRSLGIPFTIVPRKKYATVDFWSGEDGKSITLPCHTNKSGKASKLPEFCSNEWKQRTVLRWAAKQLGWKDRGVNNWIGITWEERQRRRAPNRQWIQPAYPLLDVLPMHVSGCYAAVEKQGWPEAPRSRCYHCPNQSDAEWAELTPEEFALACDRDDWIRKTDPHAFLHKSMTPLRLVTLKPKEDAGMFGGCQAGMCF
jgi:hypothetical protein